jgi:hypothetical protein
MTSSVLCYCHRTPSDDVAVFCRYTNRRYENHGSRIDFVLVDRELYDETRVPTTSVLYGAPSAASLAASTHTPASTDDDALAANTSVNTTTTASTVTTGQDAAGINNNPSDPTSHYHPMAAMRACTAYGRWQQAPFEGGGMLAGTQADYDTQFVRVVVDPPPFSFSPSLSLSLSLSSPTLPPLPPPSLSLYLTYNMLRSAHAPRCHPTQA